ncbi:hypothetical protein BDZ91DRAFT_798227 [Kalaharituber pfeilii]|nr:hypothetical protein BDZ91DRAFT_798227 [Kalaharituber pfeilii]
MSLPVYSGYNITVAEEVPDHVWETLAPMEDSILQRAQAISRLLRTLDRCAVLENYQQPATAISCDADGHKAGPEIEWHEHATLQHPVSTGDKDNEPVRNNPAVIQPLPRIMPLDILPDKLAKGGVVPCCTGGCPHIGDLCNVLLLCEPMQYLYLIVSKKTEGFLMRVSRKNNIWVEHPVHPWCKVKTCSNSGLCSFVRNHIKAGQAMKLWYAMQRGRSSNHLEARTLDFNLYKKLERTLLENIAKFKEMLQGRINDAQRKQRDASLIMIPYISRPGISPQNRKLSAANEPSVPQGNIERLEPQGRAKAPKQFRATKTFTSKEALKSRKAKSNANAPNQPSRRVGKRKRTCAPAHRESSMQIQSQEPTQASRQITTMDAVSQFGLAATSRTVKHPNVESNLGYTTSFWVSPDTERTAENGSCVTRSAMH